MVDFFESDCDFCGELFAALDDSRSLAGRRMSCKRSDADDDDFGCGV